MNAVPTPPRMDIASEIDKVAALVATARNHIAEGRVVDLTALDGRVETVCAEIKRGRPGNGPVLRTALERLIRDLDCLESELSAQFRKIRPAADSAAPQLAARAYRRPR